jgi:hypothetical protein
MTSRLRDAALKLAAKGMRVFPIIEGQKEPAIADNLKRATTDPNIITGWWRSRDFNIGLATGASSGVWVLDIDGDEGEFTRRRLEAEHGELLRPSRRSPARAGICISDGRPAVRSATAKRMRACRASISAARAATSWRLLVCIRAAAAMPGASTAPTALPTRRYG